MFIVCSIYLCVLGVLALCSNLAIFFLYIRVKAVTAQQPQHVTVSRIICNPHIAAEDDIQHDADEPTCRRASCDSLWDSSRLLGFCKVDRCVDLEDLFAMVLFQIWLGHGVCHVSSYRVSAHLPWDCGHLQSDGNIALQILCHNLERGNRKPEV